MAALSRSSGACRPACLSPSSTTMASSTCPPAHPQDTGRGKPRAVGAPPLLSEKNLRSARRFSSLVEQLTVSVEKMAHLRKKNSVHDFTQLDGELSAVSSRLWASG